MKVYAAVFGVLIALVIVFPNGIATGSERTELILEIDDPATTTTTAEPYQPDDGWRCYDAAGTDCCRWHGEGLADEGCEPPPGETIIVVEEAAPAVAIDAMPIGMTG